MTGTRAFIAGPDALRENASQARSLPKRSLTHFFSSRAMRNRIRLSIAGVKINKICPIT